jgi:acid phosphatase type 7
MKNFLRISVAAVFLLSVSRAGILSLPSIEQTSFQLAVDSPGVRKPVIVYGDTRNGHEIHRAIVRRIMENNPLAVFHTGDLVFNGLSRANWDVFQDIVQELRAMAPMYPVLGNHERSSPIFHEIFNGLPGNGKWYAVDLDGVHYVIIDNTSDYLPGSEQYIWLENYLRENASARFTIVLLHYPPYSSGPHRTDRHELRNILAPLFEKNGVDLVFSAHNHSYEKSLVNGVYYIVTAGGGAPMYPKKSKNEYSLLFVSKHHFCRIDDHDSLLLLSAIDTSGVSFDRTEIRPR